MFNMGFVYNILLSLENRLIFDKVIAISWWSTFLGHNVNVKAVELVSVYTSV